MSFADDAYLSSVQAIINSSPAKGSEAPVSSDPSASPAIESLTRDPPSNVFGSADASSSASFSSAQLTSSDDTTSPGCPQKEVYGQLASGIGNARGVATFEQLTSYTPKELHALCFICNIQFTAKTAVSTCATKLIAKWQPAPGDSAEPAGAHRKRRQSPTTAQASTIANTKKPRGSKAPAAATAPETSTSTAPETAPETAAAPEE